MGMAKVPPLRKRANSVGTTLVAHLEQLIALGELTPGDRLPSERELAESLSVSRTSLREALRQLEDKHLIERRPGRGTVVLPPPPQVQDLCAGLAGLAEGDRQVANVAELRSLIEPQIAGLAAVRATGADVLQMEDVLATPGEDVLPERSLELDIQFHLCLARAGQNPLLTALVTIASSWTTSVRKDSHRTREARIASYQGHREILDAVLAHDPAAAAEAMARHLAEVDKLIRSSTTDGSPAARHG